MVKACAIHIAQTFHNKILGDINCRQCSNESVCTQGTETTTLEELINTTLQHNYHLVITAHYIEGEPRET